MIKIKEFFDLKRIAQKQFGEPINVEAQSTAYFNRKCHANSINYAKYTNKKNNNDINYKYPKVHVMYCMCFPFILNEKESNKPIVHFINKTGFDSYIDTTFGAFSEESLYYGVEILESENYVTSSYINDCFKKRKIYKRLDNLNIVEKLWFVFNVN